MSDAPQTAACGVAPGEHRDLLLRAGREKAEGIFREAQSDLWDGGDLASVLRTACLACYDLGLDTMADVATPRICAADLSVMETCAGSPRDTAAVARLRALPPETVALAINGVIRHLLTARAEWALRGAFPAGQFQMPREEARALAATVEAALGLDLDKLDHTDLFDPLP